MRTMNTEKLLKTIPIIQNQMDALLDFNVSLWRQQLDFATCPPTAWPFVNGLFHLFLLNYQFLQHNRPKSNSVWLVLCLQVNANELTNGVINAAFMLLFKDAIRLFAAYNEGIINLLGELLSYLSFQNSLWAALHIGFFQLSLLLVPVTKTFKLTILTHSLTAA